jgi:hypothetical protein
MASPLTMCSRQGHWRGCRWLPIWRAYAAFAGVQGLPVRATGGRQCDDPQYALTRPGPEEVRLTHDRPCVMLELSIYEGIPHLLTPS